MAALFVPRQMPWLSSPTEHAVRTIRLRRELGCVLDQIISPVLELVLELELDLRHPVLQRQDTMPLRSHRLLPPDDLRKAIPRPMVQAVTDMPDTIAQDWGLLFFVSTRKNNDVRAGTCSSHSRGGRYACWLSSWATLCLGGAITVYTIHFYSVVLDVVIFGSRTKSWSF